MCRYTFTSNVYVYAIVNERSAAIPIGSQYVSHKILQRLIKMNTTPSEVNESSLRSLLPPSESGDLEGISCHGYTIYMHTLSWGEPHRERFSTYIATYLMGGPSGNIIRPNCRIVMCSLDVCIRIL